MSRVGIGLIAVCISFLSSCWIQNAPEDTTEEVSVVSDYFTKADSVLIKKFARQQKVTVHYSILSSKKLLERITKQRYNANIDVILTHDPKLREELHLVKAMEVLTPPSWYDRLDKQFAKKYLEWLPLSHNPLLVTYPSDTSDRCIPIDFAKWHKGKDTIPPMIRLLNDKDEYQGQLNASERLKWLHVDKSAGYWSLERVYSLSGFLTKLNKPDSTFNRQMHSCRAYLRIENDQFVTRIFTAGIYKDGQNKDVAHRFLTYYTNYMYQLASSRNELPTRVDLPVNGVIRRAVIR